MKLSSLFSFSHLTAPEAPAADANAEDGKAKSGNETEDNKTKSEGEGEDDGGDGSEEGGEGEGEETSAEARAAFRRGASAERRRVGQILAAPEAGANPQLAAHLACNTELSAEAAIGALEAAPAAPKGSALAAAMAANATPKVGNDGGRSPSAEVDSSWDRAVEKANAQSGRRSPKR